MYQIAIPISAMVLKISLTASMVELGTYIALLSSALITVVIFSYILVRRYRRKIRSEFEDLFRGWYAEMVTRLAIDPNYKVVTPELIAHAMEHRIRRKVVMDELMVCKKYLKGDAMQAAVNMYQQIGLRPETDIKLKSRIWSRVVKGIQEIYIFDQYDAVDQLYQFADNRNGFIRAEAQIGVVNLWGFEALKFLKNIKNHLSNWDQINMIQQLKLFQPQPLDEMPIWLSSQNHTVVIFGLKLLYEYPDPNYYQNMISCLQHQNEEVRYHAIRCCEKINAWDTEKVLEDQFSKETISNQIFLLDVLMKLPVMPAAKFLLNLMNEKNEVLQLKAAENIVKHYDKGILMLEQIKPVHSSRYLELINHLKRIA